MNKKPSSQRDRFVRIDEWDVSHFPDDPKVIHLANHYDLDTKACFIPLPQYLTSPGRPPPGEGEVYLVVCFPESQLFMEEHSQEISLITNEHGAGAYGHSAYFVEKRLYEKVRADFGKQVIATPFPGLDVNLS